MKIKLISPFLFCDKTLTKIMKFWLKNILGLTHMDTVISKLRLKLACPAGAGGWHWH